MTSAELLVDAFGRIRQVVHLALSPRRVPRRSIGCVGTRNAGMAVGHGVGCHREVR